jgi:hypothetical protein
MSQAFLIGWLILAEDEVRVQAKLAHYFPEGLEKRYSGSWRSFVVAGTPEEAISYYRRLVEVGIQYFVVETLDATDEETIRLLAEKVIPVVKRRQ